MVTRNEWNTIYRESKELVFPLPHGWKSVSVTISFENNFLKWLLSTTEARLTHCGLVIIIEVPSTRDIKLTRTHTRTPITHDLVRMQGEQIAGLFPTWHFFRIILLPGSACAECRDRLLSAETADRARTGKEIHRGWDVIISRLPQGLVSEKLLLSDSKWLLNNRTYRSAFSQKCNIFYARFE